MSDLNSMNATGRLAADPECRRIANGDSVLNFRIAVNGWKKDAPPLWLGCTVFGKRAETLANLLRKGGRVAVTGELSVREYQARDGATKTSVEIIARDVVLLDGKREGGEQRQPAPAIGGYDNGVDDSDPDSSLPF